MRTPMPDFLEDMLTRQYGPELKETIRKGYVRRPVTLRVNTLKATVPEIKDQLREAGIVCRTAPIWDTALILEGVRESAVEQLELYSSGQVYLQSLSSMIPPLILDPREKECILDMAAAPGGKTTQMAALSGNRSQITACEKNKIRAQRLTYNLEKQGASRVVVMNEDARRLDPLFSFDKILLDAPCSGSGTLLPDALEAALRSSQRTPDPSGVLAKTGKETAASSRRAKKRGGPSRRSDPGFSRELIERSARTQAELLKKALTLLKPGGELVYSTCSILDTENEQVLSQVLPGFRARILPIRHPLLEQLPLLPTQIPGTCCICPTDLYEGFFIAKIQTYV